MNGLVFSLFAIILGTVGICLSFMGILLSLITISKNYKP